MFGDRIRELIGTWSLGDFILEKLDQNGQHFPCHSPPEAVNSSSTRPDCALQGATARRGHWAMLRGQIPIDWIFVGSCHDYFAHDMFPGGLRLSISICWVPFWIFSLPWKAMSLLKLLIYLYIYIIIYIYINLYLISSFWKNSNRNQFLGGRGETWGVNRNWLLPQTGPTWKDLFCVFFSIFFLCKLGILGWSKIRVFICELVASGCEENTTSWKKGLAEQTGPGNISHPDTLVQNRAEQDIDDMGMGQN